METKTYTKTHLFNTKEEYLAFRAAWAKLAKEKKISSTMILFYNIIRGKQNRRGFSPITKPSKLENGARADQAYRTAFNSLLSLATAYKYEFKGWPPVFDKKIWQGQYITDFINQFEGTLSEDVTTLVINKVLDESAGR
jgi:hypothetical protein